MTPNRVSRPHWSLTLALAGAGSISGLVSAFLILFMMVAAPASGLVLPAIPGLMFGLAVCGTVGIGYSVPPGLDFRFVALSTLAFYLAFFLSLPLLTAQKNEPWQDGAICGFVIAGILASYVRACVLRHGHIIGPVLVVVVGTGLGAALLPLVTEFDPFRLAYLFIGWQGGFAAALGVALTLGGTPREWLDKVPSTARAADRTDAIQPRGPGHAPALP